MGGGFGHVARSISCPHWILGPGGGGGGGVWWGGEGGGGLVISGPNWMLGLIGGVGDLDSLHTLLESPLVHITLCGKISLVIPPLTLS